MELKRENNGVEKKIASPCDVEALKKCLEQNKGDYVKCQSQIEAFKSSCSLKKPANSNSQSVLKNDTERVWKPDDEAVEENYTDYAMCLGKDFEKKFESEFSNCLGYLRIINYAPPECMKQKEVEGLGMHADMSCVTVVYQGEIGGLQVRSKWMDINPCDNNLVVNVGDLMQAWTNGKLRSYVHRIVIKQPFSQLFT